jgi:hypothetical protein
MFLNFPSRQSFLILHFTGPNSCSRHNVVKQTKRQTSNILRSLISSTGVNTTGYSVFLQLQAVSRRPLTAEARVRSHVRFVVDKVALGQVFLRVRRFPLSVLFHRCSIFTRIIWGMDKVTDSCRSSTGTLSHPIATMKKSQSQLSL